MISNRYINDGKPGIILNDVQSEAIRSFCEELENGDYEFEAYDCECGCAYDQLIELAAKDRYGLKVSTRVCPECGLIMTDPRMTQKSYDRFYDSWYRSIYVGSAVAEEDFFREEEEFGHDIWVYLSANIDLSRIDNVLEIGCGAGGILNYFKKKGKNVKGIDLGKEYLEYGISEGLDLVQCNSADLARRENGRYDLIILNHVFEHFLDLKGELDVITKLLRPDGLLYIAVPGVFNLNVYDDDFLRYLQNAHTRHFCAETLTMVLEKYGFSKVCCDEKIRSVFRIGGKKDKSPSVNSSIFAKEMLYLGSCEEKCGSIIDCTNGHQETLQDMLEFVSGKKILCYGAGKYGRSVFTFLKQMMLEPTGFIVSKRQDKNEMFGKPVFEPDEIEIDPQTCILVTVSEMYSDECEGILRQKGTDAYFTVNESVMSSIRKEIISRNHMLKDMAGAAKSCFIKEYVPAIVPEGQGNGRMTYAMIYETTDVKCSDIPCCCVLPVLNNKFAKKPEGVRELIGSVNSPVVVADLDDHAFIVNNGFFTDKEVFYVGQDPGLSLDDNKDSIDDLTNEIPYSDNVIVMAVRVAMYMGFKKINLPEDDRAAIRMSETNREMLDLVKHYYRIGRISEKNGIVCK